MNEDRVIKWVRIGLEVVTTAVIICLYYPPARSVVQNAVQRAWWASKPLVRRARRFGEPGWMQELRDFTAE